MFPGASILHSQTAMTGASAVEAFATITAGERDVRRSISLVAVFSATLCLSAFLMFVIEPMIAKMILPIFGGSPMVRNTCVAFSRSRCWLVTHRLTISAVGRSASSRFEGLSDAASSTICSGLGGGCSRHHSRLTSVRGRIWKFC